VTGGTVPVILPQNQSCARSGLNRQGSGMPRRRFDARGRNLVYSDQPPLSAIFAEASDLAKLSVLGGNQTGFMGFQQGES
jgi:hypothetical protein